MANSAKASSFVSSPLGARIVVPVVRPRSLESLLPVAAAMALEDTGHVVPVTVVSPRGSSTELRAAADLAVEAERRLRQNGVSASGVVAESDAVADGVRSVVSSESATLVIMGWRGTADASRAFNTTVDDVVGRSSVPLLVVRPSDRVPERVVLPLTAEHVGPHATGGLDLAVTVTRRLAGVHHLGVSVLWAGEEEPEVPANVRTLTDRLHHDARRLDLAVGSMAQPGDIVIASVAPTTNGLRDVTNHITAATPDAALVVAIDPGPRTGHRGLGQEVADAVHLVLEDGEPVEHDVRITIDPPAGSRLPRRRVVRALAHLGTVSDVEVQWRAATKAQRLRVVVRVMATGTTAAIGEVMSAMHEAPELAGANLHYEVERTPSLTLVDELEPLGNVEP